MVVVVVVGVGVCVVVVVVVVVVVLVVVRGQRSEVQSVAKGTTPPLYPSHHFAFSEVSPSASCNAVADASCMTHLVASWYGCLPWPCHGFEPLVVVGSLLSQGVGSSLGSYVVVVVVVLSVLCRAVSRRVVCCVVLCCVVLCCVVLCCAVLCRVVVYYVAICYALCQAGLLCVVLCSAVVWCGGLCAVRCTPFYCAAVLRCATLCCIGAAARAKLCYVRLCCDMRCGAVRCGAFVVSLLHERGVSEGWQGVYLNCGPIHTAPRRLVSELVFDAAWGLYIC